MPSSLINQVDGSSGSIAGVSGAGEGLGEDEVGGADEGGGNGGGDDGAGASGGAEAHPLRMSADSMPIAISAVDLRGM
ncbi:hypothetical protein [Microbacterium sp. A94]|uniref:hypothetical protein n=1 Tax=Microbacterium sp. A94 TaxID=3450717 RepID=UPI003F430252